MRPNAPFLGPASTAPRSARWLCFILAALAALLTARHAVLTAQPEEERHIKALFLYNFAKFVDWPAELPAGPICIAVVGDDPFAAILDQVVSGKTVHGQGFVVRRAPAESQLQDCQMVFVSGTDRKRIGAVLGALKGSAVLTVGESRGFARAGGVINFEIVNNRVRFEVNVDAAERARLRLSSKLLSLAIIVHDGGA